MDVCQGEICHTPEPGETDDLIWIGFDCGHAWDIIPDMLIYQEQLGPDPLKPSYKSIDYAKKQTESVAQQAAAAK
jgi:hypothetical protein